MEYERVKEAILARYDINLETYRRRLREATKKPDETYRQLATRISDLTNQWTRDCKTMVELRELIATEQVLRALPEGIRVWVHERKPKTAAEAGQLAEDYLQARRPLQGNKRMEPVGQRTDGESVRRCFDCKQVGHLARDCPKRQSGGVQKVRSELKCFSCGQKGHIAMRCPAKALFCGGQQKEGKPLTGVGGGMEVCRTGLVEGTRVTDILLDTGCSRTLVHRDLVPQAKMRDGEVTIRCACGDIIKYPLAEVEIAVGGRKICVEAGASDTLPTSVLLGVDVPEMQSLLRECYAGGSVLESQRQVEKAWVVETRAQVRLREQKAAIEKVKEMTSMAKPNPVEVEDLLQGGTVDGEEQDFDFDEEVFEGGRERQKMTRRQKREQKQLYARKGQSLLEVGETLGTYPEVGMSVEQLKALQQEDPTLEEVRKLAGGSEGCRKGFFYRDGLLYRDWKPKKGDSEKVPVEQLVFPLACRGVVMKVAHNIPLAGHLGKNKTTNRVLQRFYWPTLYRDIAGHCRSCGECQKCPSRRFQKAPLIPLPIMSVPFDRVAMDIVGPLPRSRSGNRYILVLCDYGT